MKYLIEAESGMGEDGKDAENELIPVELCVDGERGHTTIIFELGNGREWWIPISEIDHLLYIIEGLIVRTPYLKENK